MSRLLGVLLILALAAASIWLTWPDQPAVVGSVPRSPHIADFRVTDFTATRMDPEGNPDYRLSAASLVHFADDDTSELVEPHLEVFRPDGPPWHAYAGFGEVSADGEEIRLSQGVRIVRDRPDGRLEVISDDLLIRPGEDYAETDSPVRMTSPTSDVRAIGLRAYMAEQRLELLSQVRGHYEPSSF